MTVLGIDTSLRSSGYGLVRQSGSRFEALAWGRIANPPTRPFSTCLTVLADALDGLIANYSPDAVAIEGIFYAKNVRTMMLLCHARGVVVERAARAGLPVYEYEPRKVKSAVTGVGSAQKIQIQKMMQTLLALPELPQNDAADALAIALTHLHANRPAFGPSRLPL
ncbi:MAG: crossover junction endodeoxyribonuclease RuvC [Kiritimatiellia bacterium]